MDRCMKQECLQDQKPDMIKQRYVYHKRSGRYICISGGWQNQNTCHPKKKKKKHVQIVHGTYNMKELDDAGINGKLIKNWMKEEK